MEFAKVRKGLGVGVSDLEGKNSKFRRITFVRMVTRNIPMHFQHPPIKTVEGVRKSTKKCPKMTSLSPLKIEQSFFSTSKGMPCITRVRVRVRIVLLIHTCDHDCYIILSKK